MDLYSVLRLLGAAALTLVGATAANLLSSILLDFLWKDRASNRPPRTTLFWPSNNGYPSVVVNITRTSLVSFAVSLFFAGALLAAVIHQTGDAVEISKPQEGTLVGPMIWIKGQAPGAPEGTLVYTVVRSHESPNKNFIITDVWPVGNNKWWQGSARTPEGTPVGGKVTLYAVSSSAPSFELGEELANPPRSSRRGGQSNAITVQYSGK